MVRQREKKVLRAVKAARASRHPNKFTTSNAVSQAWSVCARCVLARAGTAGAATCFRALRRLTIVVKVIQAKGFVVLFSAACASAQTIRCSRSHRLKRAREVLQQINHVLYANAQVESDCVSTFATQKRC